MFVDCQKKWICSLVTGMLHYNADQIITLLNVLRDVNSWVSLLQGSHEHETPTNKDDSRVSGIILHAMFARVY